MNKIKSSFACSWLTRCVLSLVVAVGLASTSFSAQFDGPFVKAQQKNKANWSKEDKELDKKLAGRPYVSSQLVDLARKREAK